MKTNTLLMDGRTITYYVSSTYELELDQAVVLREWVPELLEAINSDTVFVEFLKDLIIFELPWVAKGNVKEFGKQVLKVLFDRLALNGYKIHIGNGRTHYIVEITKWKGLEVKKWK